MTTARELMTPNPECIDEGSTLQLAAQKLRDLGVGAVPICGQDGRLKGMITDRDIVVGCVAEGRNPAEVEVTSAGSELVTIGADDDIGEAMETLKNHQLKRLPVIDGHDLVGILTQADIARDQPDRYVGDLIESLSE